MNIDELLQIFNNKEYISAKEIQQTLKITKVELNEFIYILETSDLNLVFDSKKGRGYKMSAVSRENYIEIKNRFLRRTSIKRKIIQKFTEGNAYINVNKLIDELYVSRNKFNNTIIRLNSELKEYNISILYKPYRGIYLDGTNFNKLKLFANYYVEYENLDSDLFKVNEVLKRNKVLDISRDNLNLLLGYIKALKTIDIKSSNYLNTTTVVTELSNVFNLCNNNYLEEIYHEIIIEYNNVTKLPEDQSLIKASNFKFIQLVNPDKIKLDFFTQYIVFKNSITKVLSNQSMYRTLSLYRLEKINNYKQIIIIKGNELHLDELIEKNIKIYFSECNISVVSEFETNLICDLNPQIIITTHILSDYIKKKLGNFRIINVSSLFGSYSAESIFRYITNGKFIEKARTEIKFGTYNGSNISEFTSSFFKVNVVKANFKVLIDLEKNEIFISSLYLEKNQTNILFIDSLLENEYYYHNEKTPTKFLDLLLKSYKSFQN